LLPYNHPPFKENNVPLILETQDFKVTGHDKPHHSRENGGHIVVWPKLTFGNLSDMPLELAAGFMNLNQIVGEAFMNVGRNNGLHVARINYACFGNWNYKEPVQDPVVHMSLYLRTWGEKHPDNDPLFLAFPEALYTPDRKTGYYDHFVPLTEQECQQVKDEVLRLLMTEKYQSITLKEL
jgi:hypothetical protein